MTGFAILGDWGTSTRRLYLCQISSSAIEVIDEKQGAGVKFCSSFAESFQNDVTPWVKKLGHPLPAVLCGMIGSNIGWREVPYQSCPPVLFNSDISSAQIKCANNDIYIVPGVRGLNHYENPDFMRGEETQILGWNRCVTAFDRPRIVCLPGTHTKWVEVNRGGQIERFSTSFQGELFEILRTHSILKSEKEKFAEVEEPAFLQAVDFVKNNPMLDLTHSLFSVRARQIEDDRTAQHSHSFLCGLLIGHDVRAAKMMLSQNVENGNKIALVGNDVLNERYAQAFEAFDLIPDLFSAEQAAIEGLAEIYRRIARRGWTA